MGCVSAKPALIYGTNAAIDGWKPEFDALQLTENDIARMFKIFNFVDMDGSGTVDLVELLMTLDIERTKFSMRVFSIFDEDSSGEIDFREFVLALWNYCTLGRATLVLFAFDLYDKDSSGEISSDEVIQMLIDVYGKKYKKNSQAVSVLKEIETIMEDGVDIEEFREFCRTHLALLFPAFQLQDSIQKKVLGREFWSFYSERRIQLSAGKYVAIGEFMEIHMKKAVYAQYVQNADKSAIKKSTLKLIENTGTFARRQSKLDSQGSKYLNNNNNNNNNEVKSAWNESKVQEKKSNSNDSDSIMDISSENSAEKNSGSLGVKQKKSFKSVTNKLITANRFTKESNAKNGTQIIPLDVPTKLSATGQKKIVFT